MEEVVVEFKGVSKRYNKGNSPYLKQALLGFISGKKSDGFMALKGINFKIKKGEVIGIIGANGSGKSTLLKLIAGVTVPTMGEVKVKGKISPLIELGAGFHPDLTGRENIYLNGTILGLTKGEVDERFDSIVEFSELNDFIDTPVKHYSSGMYMRLGFSIAIHVEPDILLVDEILSVGDIAFQKKCLDKMKEFHKEGVTIVLISHSLDLVRSFCQRVMLLEGGEIKTEGNVKRVLEYYQKKVSS